MPKATVQQLVDAGFRTEQFGNVADFATADTGYLARVLVDAEALVRLNVGNPAYDGASVEESVPYKRLQKAEMCAAIAELWARRAAFIDSNAAQGMDGTAYLNRREYLKHADDARSCAAMWIGAFLGGGDTPGEAAISDLSGKVVVTGPYRQACA